MILGEINVKLLLSELSFFFFFVISLKKLFLKGCFASCEKVKECCGGMGHSLLAGSLAEPVAGGRKDSFSTSW